jgi:hypothetical protein
MTMQVPQSTTKSELRQLLHVKGRWPYRLVRAEIIDAIMAVRKVPLKEAEDSQKVYPGEVTYLLDKFK